MKLTNSFDDFKKNGIVDEIYRIIIDEPNLSRRTRGEIRQRIDADDIFCLFEDDNLAGFLFTCHLSKKLIELSGLYIKPKFRNQGWAEFILKKVTENNKLNYLAATFLENIVKKLMASGFVKSTFKELSWREKIKFIGLRLKPHRLKEVIRHRAKNKLTLLKK